MRWVRSARQGKVRGRLGRMKIERHISQDRRSADRHASRLRDKVGVHEQEDGYLLTQTSLK